MIDSSAEPLLADLAIVQIVDKQQTKELPLFLNYNQQGGYFAMPSARTAHGGEMGFGYSSLPPYRLWTLGFQLFDHVEIAGNYWLYNDISDENLSKYGFGDYADRAVNLKFSLLKKQDGLPELPEIAIGWNDFLGSQRFRSFYTVATQTLLDCEATLGWGAGRIRGWFGGLAWSPSSWFSLAAEYDANNYKTHWSEHEKGRTVSCPVNFGAALRLWDLFYATCSSIRGADFALSLSLRYNVGQSEGLYPKIYNPPPYQAPINTEPVGPLRSQKELARELAFAFQEQGFDLYQVALLPLEKKDHLWMKLVNVRYREEEIVRDRIEKLLSSLLPSNLGSTTVVLEADGVAEHGYTFRRQDLKQFSHQQIGADELRVIAPLEEASAPPLSYQGVQLYKRNKPVWVVTFRPFLKNYFGSASGKYKFQTGLVLGPEGYLFDQIYYALYGSYTVFASHQQISDRDYLNPSRLPNVRSDAIRYQQANSLHLDQAYLQKSFNWGRGFFSRFSFGYFEVAYGGVGFETLYYPVMSNWAFGVEGAGVLKRTYDGLWVTTSIRKWNGSSYEEVPFIGYQYFFDLYYFFRPLNLDFKATVGQFLARDAGIRLDLARVFDSGLKIGFWYTFTNGKDVVNRSRYYDKGISITLPLDLFMNKSSRTRVGTALSPWLRDVGAKAATGKELYQTLFWERFNPKPLLSAY